MPGTQFRLQHIYSSVQGFPCTDYINNTIYERARKIFGVYRDFGQCTGENGSSVQGYYSNSLAGMDPDSNGLYE